MKLSLTALLLALAIALAACGSSSNSGEATASTSPSNATVSLDNGLLVDSHGSALYTNDQDKAGKVMCNAGCTQIWIPLAAPGSGKPTAGGGVSGKLGTVKRSDGSSQVTLGGKPLYTFAEDSQKGKATGDMAKDSFGGQSFTWHAEGSSASTGSGSGSSSSGSGGGGNSYGY
jgi:predicted lipoprotein with Yx(FWY)xxD motif